MKAQLFLFLTLAVSPHVMAGNKFVSGPGRVDLIELYTSEGCSSCPSAERRMNEFAKDEGLWTDFVPVEFHVDYWNYLGWTDPFSEKAFSTRQRTYSRNWRARTVYTPCFVVNGIATRTPAPSASPSNPGVLKAKVDGGALTITFIPQEPMDQTLTAWVAPLSGEIVSKVSSGENHGKTLKHCFVALALKTVPLNSKDPIYSATLPLPRHSRTKGLAVWVSAKDSQTPIQATGGWLE